MYHGAMGEYGDFYGLTARTFMGFFREFTRTDVKFNATFQERKALEPPRGSWVLQRMEYQRQQVEAERALREAADEDTPVDRAAITRTIMDAQSRK